MKTIKTNTKLVNYKGEVLKNGDDDVTIGSFISTVLAGQTNNPTLAWVLGKKFACDKTVDLKAEDIVFLKKELEGATGFTSMAIGQVIALLDSKDEK